MNDFKELGKKIGDLIVSGDYDRAYDFFSQDLKESLTKDDLISSYEEMVEYFTEEGPCNITAIEPLTTDLGEGLILVYVPIESNNKFNESEALSLTFDSNKKVTEIEFGRP